MIELYCATSGDLLGGAIDWRWPVDGKDGLLLGVLIPDSAHYRCVVMVEGQEAVRVRVRWSLAEGWREVAGRIAGAEPLQRWAEAAIDGRDWWWCKEMRIAVTGAAD